MNTPNLLALIEPINWGYFAFWRADVGIRPYDGLPTARRGRCPHRPDDALRWILLPEHR